MAATTKNQRSNLVVRGTVTAFNAEKKYGFINGDDGIDYFFHVNQGREGTPGDGFIASIVIDRAPKRRDRVYFIANPSKNGRKRSASPWAFDDVRKP